MSNDVHILGSKNGSLGPCNFYFDSPILAGDPGDDIFLGGTQGATLRYEQSKSPITYDQYGTEPANQVITGEKAELETNLVQTTLERIAAVLPGFVAHGAAADEGASQASAIGLDDLTIAKVIRMVRTFGGVELTGGDEILYFPLGAPMGTAEWTFDASTQRVLGVSFKFYRSPKYQRTTDGAHLWYFTQSALDNGHVTVVP